MDEKETSKSWMFIRDRRLPEYLRGVDEFLNMATIVADEEDNIRCPCCKCNNHLRKSREEVKGHLLRWGMEPSYIKWEFHGECSFDDESSSHFSNQEDDASLNDYDQVYSMLHDMYKSSNVDNDNEFHGASPSHEFEEPNEDAKGFIDY
ncbi:hypothetical protein PIB30_116654 [Stylosanthes scabra]|uniref:Transposase-associated domain-containing protein n=1 Tax=Stylosanthes scabra TaxID=79078 RepID=A0ABU6WDX3_9FABA|nr:hypothetical protein [Stylosanthes scabra]